jgi:predicted metalloendopeptidase
MDAATDREITHDFDNKGRQYDAKGNIRDEELMRRLKVDVHSPGHWRVLDPLSNMAEFFEAFNVQSGDAMRNEKLVKIL